ncbi:hypothetical protein PanWU01x14_005650 [Parasponia andersonii]|uniref:Uncharacterized protein n=1 Tax=Parasponia andersonii TaxID=3476 RepID=A0A2P5E3K1_PARAD|nr:hypothetical protein PanWU01x14_005650 [Parasponia andersonii]
MSYTWRALGTSFHDSEGGELEIGRESPPAKRQKLGKKEDPFWWVNHFKVGPTTVRRVRTGLP